MSELPAGWSILRLGGIAAKTSNIDPSRFPHERFELYSVPSFEEQKPDQILGKEVKSTKQSVHPDDVLLCKIVPHLNRVWTVATKSSCRQIASGEWIVYRDHHSDPHYLRYLLSETSFRDKFMATVAGVGGSLMRARPSEVAEIEIPLAPLPEQRRIVTKIGSLSSKYRRARENLDHIPRLVGKYKDAILSAAFCGSLTSDWRSERKTTRSDGSNKANLEPDLPPRWIRKPLGEISRIIDPNPSHRYPTYENGSIPLLSTREFEGDNGWSLDQRSSLVPQHVYDEQNARCAFSPKDIIFARKGRLGLARTPPPISEYTFSHTIFVIKPHDNIDHRYAIFYLRWNASIDWLLTEMNSNTGVPTLGKGILQLLPIAVPPIHEQREIVSRIEKAFAEVDRLSM